MTQRWALLRLYKYLKNYQKQFFDKNLLNYSLYFLIILICSIYAEPLISIFSKIYSKVLAKIRNRDKCYKSNKLYDYIAMILIIYKNRRNAEVGQPAPIFVWKKLKFFRFDSKFQRSWIWLKNNVCKLHFLFHLVILIKLETFAAVSRKSFFQFITLDKFLQFFSLIHYTVDTLKNTFFNILLVVLQ